MAALTDEGPDGVWARRVLAGEELVAPQLLPVECASALRSVESRNGLTSQDAAQAYEDMLALRIALLPFHRFGQRIWELRQNVTPYDAWYVVIAEAYGISLATLDRRLAQANGPRCDFLIP